MWGHPFFDLPIYRLTQEEYSRQQREFVEERIEQAGGRDRDSDVVRNIELYALESFGGQWIFNEIVGYIRLYFDGTQVLGEYFRTKAKRVRKSRTKIFEWVSHKLAAEISLPYNPRERFDPTSKQILETVLTYIDRCRKELPRGRFIDDSRLMQLAPFIDWKALWRATGRRQQSSHQATGVAVPPRARRQRPPPQR